MSSLTPGEAPARGQRGCSLQRVCVQVSVTPTQTQDAECMSSAPPLSGKLSPAETRLPAPSPTRSVVPPFSPATGTTGTGLRCGPWCELSSPKPSPRMPGMTHFLRLPGVKPHQHPPLPPASHPHRSCVIQSPRAWRSPFPGAPTHRACHRRPRTRLRIRGASPPSLPPRPPPPAG